MSVLVCGMVKSTKITSYPINNFRKCRGLGGSQGVSAIDCIQNLLKNNKARNSYVGQWLCGSVGRAVASDTRGPRFKFSHRQKFIEHLFTVSCVEKTKIKKKEAGNGIFKKYIPIAGFEPWMLVSEATMPQPL